MFRTPKNRQAKNHPILLLGSLGTQKTGSGLSVFQNLYKGDPQHFYIQIFKNIGSQGFPGVPSKFFSYTNLYLYIIRGSPGVPWGGARGPHGMPMGCPGIPGFPRGIPGVINEQLKTHKSKLKTQGSAIPRRGCGEPVAKS